MFTAKDNKYKHILEIESEFASQVNEIDIFMHFSDMDYKSV